MAKVAIARADGRRDGGVLTAVSEAISRVCDLGDLVRGRTVLLKPNVFAPRPAPTTTDPRVVVAVGELCREAGATRIIVAEGRSISTAKYRKGANSTRQCFEAVGMAAAVEAAGFEVVYLEEDEFMEVELPEAQVLRTAHVPRTILEADVFINLPVMKIHSLTLVTLAIKNLHGIVSDYDKLYQHCYRDFALAKKLTDLLRIRRVDLNVMDALVGQEADHAADGRAVEMGLILASRDAVALDAVAGAAMGLDPGEVDTTRIAGQVGLGEADLDEIEIVGESLDSVRRTFARPDVDLSEEKFPGLKVYGGDYCRSCSYYIRRGLDRLKAEGRLDADHPLALVVGKDPEVPEHISCPVAMVGDCALASESVKPLRDRLLLEGRLCALYACPPMEFRIRAAEMLD
ncbi:MAG: DUF362 domain-containing protein [Armatimonadetes bacterium]|nr:DUF362 domain-containing protein [Armatimonadota bacterium]